ncbi:MAG TPA: SpoIIE family protein phosphatase [Candidatus Acidoferrum sp.]
MATEFSSWKLAVKPLLREVLRAEQRIVFGGVMISALFAVVLPRTPLLFMGVCILVVGNAMYALLLSGGRIYRHRPFPWNWVLYIPLLVFGAFLSACASVALLRWMHVSVGPYWQVFHASWKFVVVACMVGGIAGYAVLQIQERLQAKNKLLEQAVERGTLQLQEQEQELKRAPEIQKDLLPKELPQLPGIGLAGAWQPARTVGGDYFDVLHLDDNRIGICVGDVSGKGLTASLLMANLQAAFRAYAHAGRLARNGVRKVECVRLRQCGAREIHYVFLWDFGRAEENFYIRKRGHCPGILVHAGGQTELLSGQGGVLGVRPEWTYQDFTIRLASGDRLLLYTDGVSEAANKEAEEFGYQRIAAAAASARASAADCQRRVMEEVMKFCGGEFGDDVTLIAGAVH